MLLVSSSCSSTWSCSCAGGNWEGRT